MNVFFIDRDPAIAAKSMVDSHVVKMILETCQLLSTAHRVLDGTEKKYGRYVQGSMPPRFRKMTAYVLPDREMELNLYKATHVNHPSAIWCRTSSRNYRWLFDHLHSLLIEYTYRYGKRHKCADLLPYLIDLPNNIPNAAFSDPPCAMPHEHIVSGDAVENYRHYYKYGKTKLHKYTKVIPPDWL